MLALVTGGSSGIGYELAAELARRGYDLVLASSGERLMQAVQDLRTFGRNVDEAMWTLQLPMASRSCGRRWRTLASSWMLPVSMRVWE